MPIVGYITPSYADSGSFAQGPNNVGNSGGVGFTLRKADGQSLGSYRSVGEAQAVFRQFYGSHRILKWEAEILDSGVEQYLATGLPLDPREVWLDDLTVWLEPSLGVQLRDAATDAIDRIGDRSGNGYYAAVPAGEDPTLVAADADFNERPTVDFDEAATERMDLTGLTATVPFTIVLVANDLAAVGVARNLVTIAGTPFLIGTNAAGRWQVNNGAAITGMIAGHQSAIVTVRQTAAGCELRINGETIGTNLLAPANGAVTISRSDATAWGGRLAMFTLISAVDTDYIRTLQAERYAREQFQ